MSLLNTRDSEASRRGKKGKIKTQDFRPLFSLFSVMIPRTMVQFQRPGRGTKETCRVARKEHGGLGREHRVFKKIGISTRLQPGVEAQTRVT